MTVVFPGLSCEMLLVVASIGQFRHNLLCLEMVRNLHAHIHFYLCTYLGAIHRGSHQEMLRNSIESRGEIANTNDQLSTHG